MTTLQGHITDSPVTYGVLEDQDIEACIEDTPNPRGVLTELSTAGCLTPLVEIYGTIEEC